MNERRQPTAMMRGPRRTVNAIAAAYDWRKGVRMKMRGTVMKGGASRRMTSMKTRMVALR